MGDRDLEGDNQRGRTSEEPLFKLCFTDCSHSLHFVFWLSRGNVFCCTSNPSHKDSLDLTEQLSLHLSLSHHACASQCLSLIKQLSGSLFYPHISLFSLTVTSPVSSFTPSLIFSAYFLISLSLLSLLFQFILFPLAHCMLYTLNTHP